MFGLHFKKSARTHTHTAAHIPSGNVISTTIVKHFIPMCFLSQKKSVLHQKVFCLKLLWKSLSCLDLYRIAFSLQKDISWQLFIEHSLAAQFMYHNKLTNYQKLGGLNNRKSLSHPYMTTGKTIALTRRSLVDKVMSLLSCPLGHKRVGHD